MQSLRARQNVILELGYFVAKLGRGRVLPLYRAGSNLVVDELRQSGHLTDSGAVSPPLVSLAEMRPRS
jgi:hypothetical protein